MRFQPKRSTRMKVQKLLETAIDQKFLTVDQASKLRGDLNWMYSNCAGQLGKLAGPLLTAKQAAVLPDLTFAEVRTLQLLLHLLMRAQPRDVDVSITPRAIVRVYSDASFEQNQLRLGWIIFGDSPRPMGGTCLVPDLVLQQWKARDQQIFPGETLAGLLVPWVHRPLFRWKDCIWFIDNSGAVSSLIRCTSSQEDVHQLVQFSAVLVHSLHARIWYEWIDSESNPSDGLSRDGLKDQWTLAQPWEVAEYSFPDQLLPEKFFSSFCSFLE